MKLCHVVPSLQQEHGGPSRSVLALSRALGRAGHQVELLATAPDASARGDERVEGNVRLRIFRRDFPRKICPSSGLKAALRTTDADIIHHHALWLRTLHYAQHAARSRAVPLVVSPRGMMSRWAWSHHGWRKQLSRALVHRGALEGAAAWHATSAEEAAEIGELGFHQPLCVAPNGVDAPTPEATAAAAAHWHQACPESAARPTALFYGRFHEKKRVIELMDSWLESAPREWLLMLVGIPEDYSPAMLDNYARRQLGGDRIRAFSGAGQPPPYAVASLFLLASHNENFGLTVAEAMASGVPVLVTDSTPWKEVNSRGCGWCVPWREFGSALRRATAESSEALRARGAVARQWVMQSYSWDNTAAILGSFYSTLAPSR